ncbi:MAG: septum formation protein Maf [Ottowia sp.]|nr:septum formation protein Maf [Ottowia sp.]
MKTPLPLLLASSSAYRQALLTRLRLSFTVLIPTIDETPQRNELAQDTALRLALAKAHAAAQQYPHPALIIGSDQVAVLKNSANTASSTAATEIQLGKPGNHANALAQLQMMRGRTVVFYTALCLLNTHTQQSQTANIPTTVHMRDLSDEELDAYLKLDKPYDCAGSAKSESLGIALADSIHADDPTALIGLPLIALTHMLRQANYPLFGLSPL